MLVLFISETKGGVDLGRKKSGNWLFILCLTLVLYFSGDWILPRVQGTDSDINSIVIDEAKSAIDTSKIRNEINLEEEELLIGGAPIGIYLDTNGVMVIDTASIEGRDGKLCNPAKGILKPDDYIFEMNGESIGSKAQLTKMVEELDGGEVKLGVRRENEEFYTSFIPALDSNGSYKLGIWVRDNLQGLGTLTYIDSEGTFGSLGHGIHDMDTGQLLEIHKGELYTATVNGVIKGECGAPGGLEGVIIYSENNLLGGIYINSDTGIYGSILSMDKLNLNMKKVAKPANPEEIEEGPATIYCTIDNKIQEFDIEITEVNMKEKEINKRLVLHIIDPELIGLTGGIVQGMSGSPILQNGKIVGAVTHVFVDDPTRGYGIFIENMLETAESVND